MKGFHTDIEEATRENTFFRKVLYTSGHMQLVLMSLEPKQEIGLEIHADNDQFIRCETGNGEFIIDGVTHELADGVALIIPAGAEHNVINTSSEHALKLYTVYAPPHHKDGVIHRTKAETDTSDEEFDGTTSETAEA